MKTRFLMVLLLVGVVMFSCKKKTPELQGKWELISMDFMNDTIQLEDVLIFGSLKDMLPVYFDISQTTLKLTDKNRQLLQTSSIQIFPEKKTFELQADSTKSDVAYSFTGDTLNLILDNKIKYFLIPVK